MRSFRLHVPLAAALLLLLVSPGSAVNTRQESQQQLRGADSNRNGGHHAAPTNEESKESADEDNSDDDDDDESDNDKAAEQAREAKEAQLKKRVKEAKAELKRNQDEQESISLWISSQTTGDADIAIASNVKAVANETQAKVMANFLGDMWSEQRMYQSPFYQEHQMERQALLKRVEPALRTVLKAEQLKLKRQKMAWEKEDAKADAADEEDPKKKEKDEEKVAQIEEKEARVVKDEERAEKAEKRAEKKAFDIMGPMPWMLDPAEGPPKPKAAEAAEDNRVKPAWMKALEGSDASGKKKAAIKQEDKKEKQDKEDKEDDDDDDKEEEGTEKGEEKDEKDFDPMAKPPWMNKKDKEKKAPAKKAAAKKPADPAMKPDWMKALETGDEESADEDSADEESGKSKQKAKLKRPIAHGKHTPMFTEKTMPAVSPTTKCVMILAWQFFVVYTVVAVLRSVNQLSHNRFPSCTRAQELVSMVCPYVMFAPMLSVLFLATRMRAIQLTQGHTDRYDLPQPWVQFAMYAATYGVMFQAVFKLLLFVISYRFEPSGAMVPVIYENRLLSICFSTAKYFFMACIYGGFTAVCLGAIFMPAPKEIWGDEKPPAVSAALACTLILTTTFFSIYLVLTLFRTAEELRPSLADEVNIFVKMQLLFWRARHAVNLVPMLCVLFIVCRMRALQIDPKNGNPPGWAQAGMYLCAGAMVFQVAASIILPLMDRSAYILPGPVQGQIILVMSIGYLKIIGVLMRYIPLLCMYGGASAVVASIFLMKAPEGQATPEISAMARCSIALATLYFVVFTAVYVAQTVIEFLRESNRAKRVVTVLDAGQKTVMFAPMLCVLFIAARMRALQLTVNVDGQIPPRAGPQVWVQDGMYFATGAVFMQVFLAYITTAILGPGAFSFDDDVSALRDDQHAPRTAENEIPPSSDKRLISPNWAVAGALDIFKYLCMFGMYGGVVTVMVGIVVMTPETLPPYHASPGVVQGLMKML